MLRNHLPSNVWHFFRTSVDNCRQSVIHEIGDSSWRGHVTERTPARTSSPTDRPKISPPIPLHNEHRAAKLRQSALQSHDPPLSAPPCPLAERPASTGAVAEMRSNHNLGNSREAVRKPRTDGGGCSLACDLSLWRWQALKLWCSGAARLLLQRRVAFPLVAGVKENARSIYAEDDR